MNILPRIKKIFCMLNDLFFPVRCCLCNNFVETEGLCSDCWSKIKWISDPKCNICGTPFEIDVQTTCACCMSTINHFDKAISVFEYDDFSKGIILKFKHFDCTYLSGMLSKLIYNAAIDDIKKSDLIIPVPIHPLKRFKRKYNQTELISKKISEISGVHYEPRVLKKIKHTNAQEGLSAEQRRTNISKTFGICEKYSSVIRNKNIILIDDVITTKSTANECSNILKKNGAKTVTVLALAMVIKR